MGCMRPGRFRIEGEADKSKQPMLNLATVDCNKQYDDKGKLSLECKDTQAVVWAQSGKLSVTLAIYAHMFTSDDRKVAAAINAALNP
jgi:hypothetical protein